MQKSYPYLSNLIGAYLNQDYEYFGDTIDAVLSAYCESSTPQDIDGLRVDAASFIADYPDGIDRVFAERYGFDFDPTLWQLDARSFLQKVLDVTSTYRSVDAN